MAITFCNILLAVKTYCAFLKRMSSKQYVCKFLLQQMSSKHFYKRHTKDCSYPSLEILWFRQFVNALKYANTFTFAIVFCTVCDVKDSIAAHGLGLSIDRSRRCLRERHLFQYYFKKRYIKLLRDLQVLKRFHFTFILCSDK